MAKEYIEREVAIRELLNDAPEQVLYSREDAADCIRYITAADVAPVVRCKECKRFAPRADKKYGICLAIEDTFPVSVPANHWCSFGERWTRRNKHEM